MRVCAKPGLADGFPVLRSRAYVAAAWGNWAAGRLLGHGVVWPDLVLGGRLCGHKRGKIILGEVRLIVLRVGGADAFEIDCGA